MMPSNISCDRDTQYLLLLAFEEELADPELRLDNGIEVVAARILCEIGAVSLVGLVVLAALLEKHADFALRLWRERRAAVPFHESGICVVRCLLVAVSFQSLRLAHLLRGARFDLAAGIAFDRPALVRSIDDRSVEGVRRSQRRSEQKRQGEHGFRHKSAHASGHAPQRQDGQAWFPETLGYVVKWCQFDP
jgi:hypothetical protein